MTAWGVITDWIIGLVVSLVYTIFLFILVVWLETNVLRKSTSNEVEEDEDNPNPNTDSLRLIVYLLYFLAVTSMGTTGVIFSANFFSCSIESDGSTFLVNNGWVADMSSIPTELQSWAEYGSNKNALYSSFSFFASTGTTLFVGDNGIEEDGLPRSKLWKSSNSQEPITVDGMYFPNSLLRNELSESTCFRASKVTNIREVSGFVRYDSVIRLVCTEDGEVFKAVEENVIRNPNNFIWNDETLWLTGQNADLDDWGELIFSVDLSSMEVTLHSIKEVDTSVLVESCEGDNFRNINLSILFLSALPVTFISLFVWWRGKVPTLLITAYLGISESVIAIYLIASDDLRAEFFQWWFGMSSAVWFFSLFFLYLLQRISKETMVWSLRFCALLFLSSMIVLIGVPGQFDDWWRWVIINFTVFLPLIFVGIVTESAFVLVMGAIGLFIDVWKIAFSINSATGGNAVLIYFGVFLVAGVMLGIFGWYLNKAQKSIRDFTLSLGANFVADDENKKEIKEENTLQQVVIIN